MATLFNTKIKDTYQSLLKLEDNTILTTTVKNVTDGLGNASPLYMSTTRIGIGTNAPTQTLDIQGGVRINSAGTNGDSSVFIRSYLNAAGGSQIAVPNELRITRSSSILTNQNNVDTTWFFGNYAGNLYLKDQILNIVGTNVLIGTTTDAGYKLDVNGTARFVNNITYNGNLTPLSTSSTYSVGLSSTSTGGRITAYTNNGASPMQYFNFGFNNTSLVSDGGFTDPSHNGVGFALTNSVNYSGNGGGTYTSFLLNPTLNFTNNPNAGIYRAIYYNPTLTNLTNATHIAIQTVSGNVILGSTSGNTLIGTTTDNGARLRVNGALNLTGYQPQIFINGDITSQSYLKTNLAVEGYSVIGGIGLNTDTWLTPGSGSGGVPYNIGATIHFKVNGANPLTSASSHWLAGDNGKSVGYQFLTTHYRLSVPSAWYGPEISGGIVGLQQFNIGYEPKQYGGAGFTFVGVGLSGVVSDPFTRTTEFNPIRIDYSLASGGSNITARGVYYNPSFTSVYPLLVNNAFESTSGSLVMSGAASRVSSGISRGAYLNQTLRPANMSGDVLVGLDINPTFTSSATQISTFTYVGGSGYTQQSTWTNIPLTGGTGTGATVNITVGAGNVVTAVTIANRGTGYTVNDVLTLPAQNIFTAQAGGSGFSVTVTAVGASTYGSYGLIVRNGSLSWGTGYAPYLGIDNDGMIQFNTAGQYGSRISLRPSGNQGGFGTNSYVSYIENTGYSFIVKGGNYQTTYLGGDSIVFTDGNLNERARIASSTGNLLVGTSTDSGYKLDVNGTARFSSTTIIQSTQFVDSGQIFRSGGNLALQSVAGVGNNNSVCINTSPNDTDAATAILVVKSTTKGFLPPRMTSTQRNAISSPATGLQVYDTTQNAICEYTGTAWRTISGGKQILNATTGATTIDLSLGNVTDVTLTLSTVITLSNPTVGTYVIKLIQDAIGGKTVSWPFNVLWSGSTPPTLTSTANRTDVITLIYDGVNYYGTYALNF